MKKVKVIAGAILRGAFLLAPGALIGCWAWSKAAASIAILAAAGAEALFLFTLLFIIVAIQTGKDLKRQQSEETADTVED